MLVIISILFVIGHRKRVPFIVIHDIDALFSQENLFFPPFSLKSKFIHQITQTLILVIISILFMIGHHKYVFLIAIHNINALVSQEKLFFPPVFLEPLFVCQMRQTLIIVIIYIIFVIRHHKQI